MDTFSETADACAGRNENLRGWTVVATVDSKYARDFLAKWGLELDGLAQLVPQLKPNECLLLAGSVAEGLSNAESDVDLVLIGDRPDIPGLVLRDSDVEVSTIRHESGAELSIESFPFPYMERLRVKIATILSSIADPATMERLDYLEFAEMKVLHRVRVGIPLVGEDITRQWYEDLELDRFPEIMAGLRLMDHFAAREDAISHLDEGDVDAACWVFTHAVSHMVSARLASIGETNYRERWVVTLLRRHAEVIGTTTADVFRKLLLEPVRTREEIESGIEFLDGVMMAIVEEFPSFAEVYARLAGDYPLRTSVETAPSDGPPPPPPSPLGS